MLRNDWTRTKLKLGGYTCIKHKITGELNMASKLGEIWQYDKSTYSALILPGITQSRALEALFVRQQSYSKSSDLIVRFNKDKLATMVSLLNISKVAGVQLKYANRF